MGGSEGIQQQGGKVEGEEGREGEREREREREMTDGGREKDRDIH